MKVKFATHLVVVGTLLSGTAPAWTRDLTLEERLQAQEAIERIYYSHQIAAARAFEEAVPRELLEKKVRTYLQQSAALERFWKTPVTGEMLRRELERMARHTRMPDRLKELYAALGGDPFLIQECLVRPTLVNRLARNFFNFDPEIHARERAVATAIHRELAEGRLDPPAFRADRSVINVVRVAPGEGGIERALDSGTDLEGGAILADALPEDFDRLSARLEGAPGQVGPVEDEPDAFRIRVALHREPARLRMAVYTVPKRAWDDWWSEVESGFDPTVVRAVATDSAIPYPATPGATGDACADDRWNNASLDDVPEARNAHLAFWTGNLMLIWGGTGGFAPPVRGARYEPATDTWTPISQTGMPTNKGLYSGVWTGKDMVLWGSEDESGTLVPIGGRYDPINDSWAGMSQINAPDARSGHSAVWTGSAMIVWGGANGDSGHNYLATGGRYDPQTDTWSPISALGAPEPRSGHSAIWSGSQMLVWGGGQPWPGVSFNTGGRYDPMTDAWLSMSTLGAPDRRTLHSTVWTGQQMVVWGGSNSSTRFNTGGRYDPVTDQWLPTSLTGAPSARESATAVWTGTLMIVWGGIGATSSNLGDGARYDPSLDQWTPMRLGPEPRYRHTAIWTGSLMIIWGGYGSLVSINTGGRYDPGTDSWTPTSSSRPLSPRENPVAVWTGTVMVIWGGFAGSVAYLGDGARYDPATDTWSPTSTTGAPSRRKHHTAVWTGDRMIVFGGVTHDSSSGKFPHLNTGGRYDPVADTWSPMSVAPEAGRSQHTVVWTGTIMIVWGGRYDDTFTGQTGYPNFGNRYDPIQNTWSATTGVGAPLGRFGHSAIWTGTRMVVWGGWNPSGTLADGGSYDPVGNRWAPVATSSAPSARQFHSSVWTGTRMIVWGGYGPSGRTNSGAAYDPTGDSWSAIASIGAPAARFGHVGVWTGGLMLVWGGSINSGDLGRIGGRYDPETDQWAPMASVQAPAGRLNFSVVWFGDRMAVWGGSTYGSYLNDGGFYCACAGPLATLYRDADGDGRGDPAVNFRGCEGAVGYVADGSDCDDGDASVWGTPTEVWDVLFLDDATLVWSAPALPGADSATYDVLRSATAVDFVGAAICEASGSPSTLLVDSWTPSPGEAGFYLVRALNGCPGGGVGTLGVSSDGTLRPGRTCP